MSGSGYSYRCVRLVFVLVLAVLSRTNTHGAEVDVKNDSLADGNSGTPCACFVSGESAAAWLTSPCHGDIVAVQVFWRSQFGGGPGSTEMAISIFGDGTFPTPGAVLVNQDASPAVITGPTLSDGALNEFRHLDAAQTIPLGVPVTFGETFVVSLEVVNQSAGDIFAPTFVYDVDGCQANRNAVDVMPGGWFDACLLGVTGDWMIRAVVDCGPEPPALAPPPHDIRKIRYISIDPRGATETNPDAHHIRVTLDSTLVNGMDAGQVGSVWWANDPDAKCISLVGPSQPASEPDWSACPILHLSGCAVIPTSTYRIATVIAAGGVSADLIAQTQLKPNDNKWWGDAVGSFDGAEWSGPQGTASFEDVTACLKTFINPNAINATHVSLTDIHPNRPDLGGTSVHPNKLVNFDDCFNFIQGFQGKQYPGGDLAGCTDP